MNIQNSTFVRRCFLLLSFLLGLPSIGDSAEAGAFGIRTTVSTSSYRFQQPVVSYADERGGSFLATASISNGSKTPISFSFPSGLAEGQRIVFKVFTSDGHEIWRSEAQPAGEPLEQTLRPGGTWKRSTRIPLVLFGSPLPAGTYSLEAGLANDDPVLASTIFEVAAPANAGWGTVNGVVLTSSYSHTETGRTAQHSFALGAYVTAQRLLDGTQAFYPGFSPSGGVMTDAEGRFTRPIAPGRYAFSAVLQAGGTSQPILVDPFHYAIGLPAFSHGSTTVTVSAGKTSRPVIMMGTVAEEKERIHATGDVTLMRDPADPRFVIITARGVVNSGGWTMPDLVSRELDSEGLLLMDFMARAPRDIATQAFENVSVTVRMPLLPGMTGVAVRSKANTVKLMFAQSLGQ